MRRERKKETNRPMGGYIQRQGRGEEGEREIDRQTDRQRGRERERRTKQNKDNNINKTGQSADKHKEENADKQAKIPLKTKTPYMRTLSQSTVENSRLMEREGGGGKQDKQRETDRQRQ